MENAVETSDNKGNELYHLLELERLRAAAGGGYSYIERTEFGKHIDEVNGFYGGLSDEQKELFVTPLGHHEGREAFENSLNDSQREQWDNIKDEAGRLEINVTPDNLSDLELAATNLRNMVDQGFSDNPEVRAIQEQTIESLGGIEGVNDIIQKSMTPGFDLDDLSPEVQGALLEAQNGQHEFVVTADNDVSNDAAATVDAFFDGETPEEVGQHNGGAMPDDMVPANDTTAPAQDMGQAPAVTNPGLG